MAEQYHEWLMQPRDDAAAAALRYTREARALTEETLRTFQDWLRARRLAT